MSLKEGSQYSSFSYMLFFLSVKFPIPWAQKRSSFNLSLFIWSFSSSSKSSPMSARLKRISWVCLSMAGPSESDASFEIYSLFIEFDLFNDGFSE